VIQSFADRRTERLFLSGECPARWRSFERVAQRKLYQLATAVTLRDLASPPGNHLEALRHDRVGQHSIRINDQWRVCFVWTQQGPEHVEIVDYH
jgi:proteic killer suppression protein